MSPSPWLSSCPQRKAPHASTKGHVLFLSQFLFSAPRVLCVDYIFANEVLGHIFKEKARMTDPNQKTKDHLHLHTNAHDVTVELLVVYFDKIINAY